MKKIVNLLSDIYCKIFGLRILEGVNKAVLNLALKAHGYNNFKSTKASGEDFFIKKVLKKTNPKVCIDVGANIGNYTRTLLQETNTEIFSFEPLQEPFDKLSKMQAVFGNRLVPINKGVGSKNETLKIYFNNDATSHASLLKETKNIPYINNDLSQEIEITTLDSFFSDKPHIQSIDLLKIDTEGFEFEVLLGANNLISNTKPKFIQIEYNWHQLFKPQTLYSFSTLLLDYEVFQMLPKRLVKRDAKDPFSNIYHFSNFVFVRKDCISLI